MISETHSQTTKAELNGLSMDIAADKLRQIFPEVFAEKRIIEDEVI